MIKMSKICPKCHARYSDSDNFCPKCGVALIGNTDHNNPAIIIGDANAISGGININQSKSIITHDVHYHTTTVQKRTKSEAELKLEAINRIRAKAEEIFAEKGRIDKIAIGELRHIAIQQGIDDNEFGGIIKDVRSNRIDASQELSTINSRYLHQAEQAIKSNDIECLMNLLPRLESMASISLDDKVQYLYHLTLSLFKPQKTIEAYEQQTDENYWRTFWAIISYIRVNQNAEASHLLAKFDPIRYDKPEGDQILIEAYFNLMKNDKAEALTFLNEINGTLSKQLLPFLQDIKLKTCNDVVCLSTKELFESGFYFQWILLNYGDALNHLGERYEFGFGVEINDKEAFKWYSKAAEAGNAKGMTNIGFCYSNGKGVDRNVEVGIKWFKKAAEIGDAIAMYKLGNIYKIGVYGGIKTNHEEAFKWYSKAAEAGYVEAMFDLGFSYYSGMGCFKSNRKALKWYRKAAGAGHKNAMKELGNLYCSGERIYIDKEEAFNWYCKAAEIPKELKCSFSDFSNCEAAQKYYHKWGIKYLNGEGVCKDEIKAEDLLLLSVRIGLLELGLKKAKDYYEKWKKQFEHEAKVCKNEDIAYFFSSLATKIFGESMKVEAWEIKTTKIDSILPPDKTIESAEPNKIKELQKLAQTGDGNAMNELGICYENGDGVNQNYNEAANWYHKAADKGINWAMCQLGDFYLDGKGVNQDDKKAYKWFHKGAEAGNLTAMTNVGYCYEFGRGIKKDPIEAMKWYQKALDNGYQMDDWLSQRMEECKLTIPSEVEVIFNQAWATAPNDANEDKWSIYLHLHFQINHCKNRRLYIRFTTELSNENNDSTGIVLSVIDDVCTPDNDFCEWKDYIHWINESDQIWPNAGSFMKLKTTIQVLNTDLKPLTSNSYWITYDIYHKIRLFHDNELYLAYNGI